MDDLYTDAELRRVLAEDGRTAELGIEIIERGNTIVLCGQVETPERRAAIERLVSEKRHGYRVVNEIVVVAVDAPARAEELG